MQLQRFADVREYYQRVEPFLLRHEAEHNLMLGLCTTLMKTDTYQEPPYLALVEQNGHVISAVIRTPPNNLVLSEMEDTASLKLIANDVRQVYGQIPGVLGAKVITKAFAQVWQNVTGQPGRLKMQERVYRLERVNPVTSVSGEYALPSAHERNLLVQWWMDFAVEALDGIPRELAERQVDMRLTSDPELRGLRLWCDGGQVVSLAGYGGLTPNGIRVGPVYTPPELRGRGYASACVAALSQELLDKGRRFVFLFTDLSNPTSNHIYQSIGYQPISDVDEYRFSEQSS